MSAPVRRALCTFLWLAAVGVAVIQFSSCTEKAAEVQLECEESSLSLFQGEVVSVRLRLVNRGSQRLADDNRFFISYHLLDRQGHVLVFDNRRFSLPRLILPHSRSVFSLPLFFACPPGSYRVQIDLVKEGEFWGSRLGWGAPQIALTVRPLFSETFRKKYLRTLFVAADEDFNREQYVLRQVFKNSEIRSGGMLFGFAAGSAYPALWIRDMATFIRSARWHYPFNDLRHGVEQFFRAQKEDGEVADWIDRNGRSDKNTVESDQESSLVIAAAELALGNPSWLRREIAGRTPLVRMDQALDWLWRNRRDPGSGLLTSGFTIDWGDVERSYPDQRAVKLSDRSQPVVGIYTQAKFLQAAVRLADIYGLFSDREKERKWRDRSDWIRQAARRRLYLKERGYFISHVACGDPSFRQLEEGMLAVGGNAEAILAGMLNRGEVEAFVKVLERRQEEYRLRSVSFTLIPPYPEGFFPHPLLRQPWSYQNGGEWDWIGGRVVQALFASGFRQEALAHLREIVSKHLREFTVFEWQDRSGNGRGAANYVGAAGVVGEALMRGVAGMTEDFTAFRFSDVSLLRRLDLCADGASFSLSTDAQGRLAVHSQSGKKIVIEGR